MINVGFDAHQHSPHLWIPLKIWTLSSSILTTSETDLLSNEMGDLLSVMNTKEHPSLGALSSCASLNVPPDYGKKVAANGGGGRSYSASAKGAQEGPAPDRHGKSIK